MNKSEIIKESAYKLASRLYEIDKKLDKDNFMLVDEYNMIVEELWNRIPSLKDEQISKKQKEIQPEINIIKFDVDWLEIKNLCRTTVNMTDSSKEPNDEWKRKLLIAEHSPLRHSLITVEFKNIPYFVVGHLVRHHQGIEKYVTTSREDRTNVPRTERRQTDLVNMKMDLNIQALINISRKRLCSQADISTQKIWFMLIREIAKYDENIAWACVPEGIYKGGCSESFGNCKKCNSILEEIGVPDVFDIQKRYDCYKKIRKRESK